MITYGTYRSSSPVCVRRAVNGYVLRFTIPRLSAIAINVAVVVYLITRLRRERSGQGRRRADGT